MHDLNYCSFMKTHVYEAAESVATAAQHTLDAQTEEEQEVRTKRKQQDDITSQPPKKTRDGEHQ